MGLLRCVRVRDLPLWSQPVAAGWLFSFQGNDSTSGACCQIGRSAANCVVSGQVGCLKRQDVRPCRGFVQATGFEFVNGKVLRRRSLVTFSPNRLSKTTPSACCWCQSHPYLVRHAPRPGFVLCHVKHLTVVARDQLCYNGDGRRAVGEPASSAIVGAFRQHCAFGEGQCQRWW